LLLRENRSEHHNTNLKTGRHEYFIFAFVGEQLFNCSYHISVKVLFVSTYNKFTNTVVQ